MRNDTSKTVLHQIVFMCITFDSIPYITTNISSLVNERFRHVSIIEHMKKNTSIAVLLGKKTTYRTPTDRVKIPCYIFCSIKHTGISAKRSEEFSTYTLEVKDPNRTALR